MLEPLLISGNSRHQSEFYDLVVELAALSAGLRRCLPHGVSKMLTPLLRVMNCYHCNVLEGVHVSPLAIEQSLNNEYSDRPDIRINQQKSNAHMAVHEWVTGRNWRFRAATVDGILSMHRKYHELIPNQMCLTDESDGDNGYQITPGAFRKTRIKQDGFSAFSPGAVTRFMERFESVYSQLGRADTVLACAAAHHRLSGILPFPDCNGRIACLNSDAMLSKALDTGGIWSLARGLARRETEYRLRLENCNQIRRDGLDGRGDLSETALIEFTRFFLQACIDEVKFMEQLIDPVRLRNRILNWAIEEVQSGRLPQQSVAIFNALLIQGELPRREISQIIGTKERQARRISSALIEREALIADSSRSPLRLAFSVKLTARWMPGLFPDNVLT